MNKLAFAVSPPSPYIQSPGPLNPPMIGGGTYTSWPGGVDPSSPLYSGHPVPLSMQRGGRRSSRKANRKASRRSSRKTSRKASRRSSRKGTRKANRKH